MLNADPQHILVIRAGALGDLVFCCQSFAEIRHAHPDAEIALLTRAPFAEFARAMPWFDRIIIDTHPKALQWGGWARLVGEIRRFAPTRVYDLQGKKRQTILYALLGGPLSRMEWSGAAPGCTFPRPWPPAPDMHFTQFLAAQLRVAKVPALPPVALDWLGAPVKKFGLPEDYVVLIPGCSPAVMRKRWSPENYADIANRLYARGVPCVVVGTKTDAETVAAVKKTAPAIIDLCGQTTLAELTEILRQASCVIGNDTGPLHLAGATGTPTLAVLSGHCNPIWSRPPGQMVAWRQRENIADLSADEIWFAFGLLLQHAKGKG